MCLRLQEGRSGKTILNLHFSTSLVYSTVEKKLKARNLGSRDQWRIQRASGAMWVPPLTIGLNESFQQVAFSRIKRV